jgi:hypothetical protein
MDTEDSIIFSSDMQGGGPNKEYIYPEALVNVSKYVPQLKKSVLTLEDAVQLGYINKLGPLGALLLLSQGMLTVGNQSLTGGALQDGSDVGYYTYSEKIRNIFNTLISKLKPDKLAEDDINGINDTINKIQIMENNIYELLYKIGSIIEETEKNNEDGKTISFSDIKEDKNFNNLIHELKEKRKELEKKSQDTNILDNYKNLLKKIGL